MMLNRRSSELDVGVRFIFLGTEYMVEDIRDISTDKGNYTKIAAKSSSGVETILGLKSSTMVQVFSFSPTISKLCV